MTARHRWLLVSIWVALAAAALYLYLFQRDAIQARLTSAFSASMLAAGAIYLALGAVRAFTLIPSTYLVIAALPFIPRWPLLVFTVAGILASSAIIYRFAEALKLEELFERGKHKAHVDKLRVLLQRHELPVIIGWSFFPLAPTDLICYVCGGLRINFPKFLLGVALGEGTICAIYIFVGGDALRWLELSF